MDSVKGGEVGGGRMRVVLEEEVRSWSQAPASCRAPHTMSCLLDLHVRCPQGRAPGIGVALPDTAAKLLLEGVVERAAENGVSHLDLAFFGGEPLLSGEQLLDLSLQLRRVCELEGIDYAGHLISDGTLLAELAPRRLAAAGLARIQVTFEGEPRGHDRRPRVMVEGERWAHLVDRLTRIHGVAQIVVRTSSELLASEVQELLRSLDEEGLLGRGGIMALYLARPAPYEQQARDLLRVFALLRELGDEVPARFVQ
jgi:hypothetical protein